MPGINMMPSGSTLQIPLDACTGFSAKAGNAKVELTWTDPKDKYATPEGDISDTGDQLVSEWDHTVLVRKTGSQPAGPNDGTVVVSSSVRNQYQSTAYVDSGLTNDTTYYYAVFAYNKDGVASEGAFASATPMVGTPLGDLTEGTLITINENGAPVEFYVAKHNYEPGLNGDGRTLIVRKEAYDTGPYDNYDPGNPPYQNQYSGCDMDNMFNTTYKNLFSEKVQSYISNTSFYYIAGGPAINTFSSSTLTRSIFALSAIELTNTTYNTNYNEGEALPIRNILETHVVWTRSPYTRNGSGNVIEVEGPSTIAVHGPYLSNKRIPCFTLPATALVDPSNALIES